MATGATFWLRTGSLLETGSKPGSRRPSGPGNALPLKAIRAGTQVHNIELHVGRGGQIVRGAGTSAQVLAKEGRYTLLRLPSGEVRNVLSDCMATVGQLSAPGPQEHQAGQGGAQTSPGSTATGARSRYVAQGPSARRRRGPFAYRNAGAKDAVGQARAGPSDAQEQADGQIHRKAQVSEVVVGGFKAADIGSKRFEALKTNDRLRGKRCPGR